MTNYGSEILNTVAKVLDGVAEVTLDDKKKYSIVHLKFKSGQTLEHKIIHGMGYSSTARDWAKSILISHGPGALGKPEDVKNSDEK